MREIKNNPGTICVRWWEVHYGEETRYRVTLYNEDKVIKEAVVNTLEEAEPTARDMYERFTTIRGQLATPEFLGSLQK
tara:strand:- start:858 stop:1091 length:234 start_codon:yes stop_codon:yes gene_type:complete